MKKVLLLIILCFFININLVSADELICEYKYNVYMNSGLSFGDGMAAVGDDISCGWDNMWSWTGLTEECDEDVSYVETTTVPVVVTVKVKPDLAGTNPKFVVSFSDACDPNSGKCSKTKVIEGSSQKEFENNNLHIDDNFFTELTDKGECPENGYIDLYNLKTLTPGYNELCFSDLSICKKNSNNAFDFEEFGYNRWVDESSMKVTNQLDGKAKEIEKLLNTDTFSSAWPLNENTCTTLFQPLISAANNNYNKVKEEQATKYANDVINLTHNTIKNKYPNGGEGLWTVLHNRIAYVSTSGGVNVVKPPYEIANNHLDKVKAYCKGEVDADETLSEEEKEEAKNRIDEQTGENKEKSKRQYVENFNIFIGANFSGGDTCEGYLGDPNGSGSPAYYLQIALNVMKYLAIILALVFSVIDFVKATVSQDKALLTKATGTSVKRLIYAIIIFFLPIVINFILGLIGAYSTCVS